MERRFTLIQGGLQGGLPGGLRAGPGQRAVAPHGGVDRVTLLRAAEIGPVAFAAWCSLAAARPDPDPFADPDYLLTAALNAGREADIVFAFAHGCERHGRAVLRGVLPLTMPHPIWGGAAIRLWQPALATRPVEPAIETGAEAETLRAVLRHLRTARPQATLRFSRIAADSALIPALANDDGLRIAVYRRSAVPPGSIVDIAREDAADRLEGTVSETITKRSAMRDAVERFLLVDAEQAPCPLIAEPGAASIVRVATRLFALREAVCVELDRRGPAIVGGAIRLGPASDRVLWRAVNRSGPRSVTDRADIVIGLAERSPAAPRTRPSLVAP